MKRFLLRLACFAAIQFVIGLVIVLRDPGPPRSFMFKSKQVHDLAARTSSPRLFIVGGSNVAFGVDSPVLHQALGYHPINMATSAGVGLDFMLNQVEDLAERGDAILLSLEYGHFQGDTTDIVNIEAVLAYRPQSVEYLSWPQRKQVLDRGLAWIHNIVRRGMKLGREEQDLTQERVVYSAEAYNEYGDLVAHHGLPGNYASRKDRGKGGKSRIDEDYVESRIYTLNDFAARCEARGVRVLFTFPPMAEDAFGSRNSTVGGVVKAIQKGLEIPTMMTPQESTMPGKLFFDSAYHPILEGKQRRTALLAPRLAAALERSGPQAVAAVTRAYGNLPKATAASPPEGKSRTKR